MTARALAATFVVGAAFAASPSLALDCAIGRAVYSPVGNVNEPADTAYELVHSDREALRRQSNLSVTIRHGEIGQSHDFTYAFANGYGGTSLIYAGPTGARLPYRPTSQSPGSAILFFDAAMRVTPPVYELGAPAPAFLIMPEMGGRFWYGGDGARKFIPPDGLWKLTACR